MITTAMRTSYKTLQDAQADGWRRVNQHNDCDISGGNWVGYEYQASDGQTSTTITLTQDGNNIATSGFCIQMFRI